MSKEVRHCFEGEVFCIIQWLWTSVLAAVVKLLMKFVEGEYVVALQIKVSVGVTYGNTDKLLLGLALIHCARALHRMCSMAIKASKTLNVKQES